MTEIITPGSVFAGYRIERVLGRGGMGTVYVGVHPRLPRMDALKVLSENFSADAEFRARFVREAELAARLEHPNIVAVHDQGVANGRLWIAMQFVDGPDAAELIRRGAAELPPERVLHIIGETARGLDEAHRAGMLHRDVKPANILLEPRPGQPERVYVTDFGIAKAVGEATALTDVGSVLATLAYTAPEQLMAQAVDHRADVYALGCTLYELLTGGKPFPRATAVSVMQAHLQDPPPCPTAVNPALPPAIDNVVARAMAKNPDDRYPSCGALANAAAAALRGSADTPTYRVSRPVRRRRPVRTIAVAAAVTLAAVAFVSLFVLSRNSDVAAPSPSARGTTSAGAAASATTAAAGPVSWGNYSYIAQALPELLPASPFDSGYQGLRCVAADKDDNPVDVNQPAAAIGTMSCTGNRDPVLWIRVGCNANRNPTYVRPSVDSAPSGDQRWERASGRGRVLWQDSVYAQGGSAGVLKIEFEGSTRNFCQVTVFGGNSGQDLYDRWWPSAPF
ncbi:serine/threonine-protein kinase [Nocardia sp. GCM10030253]|uniref:serine/threonine-protein kinase n=1 Tax=Nocardia sp. GCM10030253 TaxID=3273404 RepID=UPI003640608F